MFEHGVEYHPYCDILDISKVRTVYISDIARYIPRPSLSSLYLLLTSHIPTLDHYKDMIDMYTQEVVEATGGNKNSIALQHIKMGGDDLKIKRLMVNYEDVPEIS
jgi:hypothetical protein